MDAHRYRLDFALLKVDDYCKRCLHSGTTASLNFGSDPLVVIMRMRDNTYPRTVVFHVLDSHRSLSVVRIDNVDEDLIVYSNPFDEQPGAFERYVHDGCVIWRSRSLGLGAVFVNRNGVGFRSFTHDALDLDYGDLTHEAVPNVFHAAVYAHYKMREVDEWAQNQLP